MKKIIAIFFIVGISTISFSQSFTKGTLVVLRYGGGDAALSFRPVPIFLDEFDVLNASKPIQSIALPTKTVGSNFRITGVPKYGANVTREGFTALSQDNKILSFYGYDAEPGASAKDANRIIGRIDGNGKINTSTTLEVATIGQLRSVIADKENYWLTAVGVKKGIQYLNTSNGNLIEVSNQPAASRSLYIYEKQLYVTTPGTPAKIFKVGSGLPTTEGNDINFLPILGSTVAVNQLVMFDVNPKIVGPDLIYIVNDDNAPEKSSIQKFSFDGKRWQEMGNVCLPGVTDNLKSLTGSLSSGVVTIYAITTGNELASPSALLKIVDNNPQKNVIDKDNSAPIILSTAPANTMYRSVTFSPVK